MPKGIVLSLFYQIKIHYKDTKAITTRLKIQTVRKKHLKTYDLTRTMYFTICIKIHWHQPTFLPLTEIKR